MSDKRIVCLDPGHGPTTVNGSPDGTYKEKEFAWDMFTRINKLLSAQGIVVIGTRTANTMPSLTERAQTANKAGADLFVSLHSNAAGNGGWYDASGFLIYTSASGDNAERNIAAKAIIAQAKAAGINVRGSGLAHEMYTVLAKTVCPAVLIEYGFHTSKADVALLKDSKYRDKLAQITAKGICDYLNIAYQDADKEEGEENKPDMWAVDAWERAAKNGIIDGTRPREAVTRQELIVILSRLGLI